MLKIDHVTLRFPLMDKHILDDICYEIMEHDFIIVLGGNGSGKSSLLKLIDKRYTPSGGRIFYRGCDIKGYSSNQYYGCVKTITQSTSESLFSELTIFENYQLFALAERGVSFANAQDLSNYLAKFNGNLARKLQQKVSYLSGGEKQALVLALTMLNPPDLLLLDEHTSALDPKSADSIMELTNQLIREYRVTCLLTTHDLTIATRYGDRLMALKDGSVHHMADQPEKQRLSAADLRELCY